MFNFVNNFSMYTKNISSNAILHAAEDYPKFKKINWELNLLQLYRDMSLLSSFYRWIELAVSRNLFFHMLPRIHMISSQIDISLGYYLTPQF